MADLNTLGIDWYLKPTAASTDASTQFLATTDAAAHCYASTDDYTILNHYIQAAERLIEGKLRRPVLKRTFDLVMARFPASDDALELPMNPVDSVASVAYYDTNNTSTSMASTDYVLHQSQNGVSHLRPQPDETWPSCKTRDDAVTIQFVGGYSMGSTDTELVPKTIIQAGLLLVGHWYRNRESVVVGSISKSVEDGVDALLAAEDWGWCP